MVSTGTNPSVNLLKYLFSLLFFNTCMLYIWWNNLLEYFKVTFKQTSVQLLWNSEKMQHGLNLVFALTKCM